MLKIVVGKSDQVTGPLEDWQKLIQELGRDIWGNSSTRDNEQSKVLFWEESTFWIEKVFLSWGVQTHLLLLVQFVLLNPKSAAAVYQEHLEHFMPPTTNKHYRDTHSTNIIG